VEEKRHFFCAFWAPQWLRGRLPGVVSKVDPQGRLGLSIHHGEGDAEGTALTGSLILIFQPIKDLQDRFSGVQYMIRFLSSGNRWKFSILPGIVLLIFFSATAMVFPPKVRSLAHHHQAP
jgi:hypothetical protein